DDYLLATHRDIVDSTNLFTLHPRLSSRCSCWSSHDRNDRSNGLYFLFQCRILLFSSLAAPVSTRAYHRGVLADR
ncbi:hypothetical protein PMAYCL1PPCAC_01148, partial [Pristionchus mayeri]